MLNDASTHKGLLVLTVHVFTKVFYEILVNFCCLLVIPLQNRHFECIVISPYTGEPGFQTDYPTRIIGCAPFVSPPRFPSASVQYQVFVCRKSVQRIRSKGKSCCRTAIGRHSRHEAPLHAAASPKANLEGSFLGLERKAEGHVDIDLFKRKTQPRSLP